MHNVLDTPDLNKEISWDIELNFDMIPEPLVKSVTPGRSGPPREVPARQVISEKAPHLVERIKLLWGSIELHNWFQRTLYLDRTSRQGFSQDVLSALGEINVEHVKLLEKHKILSTCVWVSPSIR